MIAKIGTIELDGKWLDDSMTHLSFFDVPGNVARDMWDKLWEGVKDGRIFRITPLKWDGYNISVRNEYLEWTW